MALHPADPAPERLCQESDGTLVLEWSDGHQSTFTPQRLRAGCPCALCREERGAGGQPEAAVASPPRRDHLRKLERIGRYGISLTWGDGHNTGIYSWPLLRLLCDCMQCRLDRGEL